MNDINREDAQGNRIAHAPIFTNPTKTVQRVTPGRWLKKPKELCHSRLGSDLYLSLLVVGLLSYQVLLGLLVYSIYTFTPDRGPLKKELQQWLKQGET